MSPEIKVNGKLIANIPDDYGVYTDMNGKSILVDSRQLDATGERQRLIVEGPAVEGRRTIGLTLEGTGNSGKLKKGGDGQEPLIEVKLHNRPIRVTYSPRVWPNDEHLVGGWGSYYYEDRVTRNNPRWVRGHGQR